MAASQPTADRTYAHLCAYLAHRRLGGAPMAPYTSQADQSHFVPGALQCCSYGDESRCRGTAGLGRDLMAASESPSVHSEAPSRTRSLSRNWPRSTDRTGNPPAAVTPGVVNSKFLAHQARGEQHRVTRPVVHHNVLGLPG